MNRGESLSAAVEALRAGGTVAYPTESVYGLGCDALDGDAVAKLLILKGRPVAKGLIVIGASLHQLEPLLRPLTGEQRETLESSWPAALTW
jgi:L-threonylcarbamoyladenylate synthase